MTRESNFIGKEIRVSNMDASDRILLNVITHILFNKSGNWACGSEPEFFAMSCILQGEAFNIPYFMMQRMARCAIKKSPLPYLLLFQKF